MNDPVAIGHIVFLVLAAGLLLAVTLNIHEEALTTLTDVLRLIFH